MCLDQNLVSVNVNFMGSSHVLVEENVSFSYENIEERKGRNGFKGVRVWRICKGKIARK
ncbi:hypothetical protein SLEP1_g60439 [Rubroshorea leprosula]|uniref:Uncharacterized protein n=1 Tax=Rubroshorea leprosula TaxID=152421 RepID=A0AAV5MXQ4_9ROSI|nr:hypothetical protein SLEP1_g60367 [Rubroshorea leprosula]GKV53928.1 hypothetical protein SLEP1_g60439 [Rubroshorea leprosula]